jgi:YVTN family beta-propeller protein
MALSDDGKTAFISMGRANHIAFVDIASRKILAYVLVGSRAWNITESPDHKLLYVANGLSDDVSIIDLASRKNIKTIAAGRTPHSVLVDG